MCFAAVVQYVLVEFSEVLDGGSNFKVQKEAI